MKSLISVKLLLLATLTVSLAGCGDGEPEDVRQWMAEQTKDMKGKVPELPQIKSLPPIVYEPGDAIQPFANDKLFADDSRSSRESKSGRTMVNPDVYPLTRAPLDSFRLVGTMTIGKQIVAIVATERDTPRQARVGDYIGQNMGRIKSITPATMQSDGEIVIVESVLEKGLRVERETRIGQPAQGDKK
jgi:type IV pilus assembly protein PilP